ncbi:MAG TPA: 2TM domain-containing protein [Arenibacter sp.]|nr:2TM domain-containing protein [Arenibacter sp.]
MEQNQYDPIKLEKAKKRLLILKAFYSHLVVYLVVCLLMLLFFVIYRVADWDMFPDWVRWNIMINLLLWSVGLFFHWVYAFRKGPKFLRNWEERQIKKYMEKQDADLGSHQRNRP